MHLIMRLKVYSGIISLETPKLKDNHEQNITHTAETVNTSILRPKPFRPRMPPSQKIASPLSTNSKLYLPPLPTLVLL